MKQKLTLCLLLLSLLGLSQAPDLINYQGIARDASGTPIAGTLGVKFELRQGGASGPVVFSEVQSLTTGTLGVFSTQIGKVSGSNFNTVNWESGSLFLEVSLSLSGGTYTSLGVQQLVSVPFSKHAQTVPATYTNNTLTIGNQTFVLTPATGVVYTASTGISITSGSVITNTAPDVPVTFTSSSSNIGISGSYPNFGITYTASSSPTSLTLNGADNNSLSAGSNTVVLNTYTPGTGITMSGGPNYTISSSAANPTINGAGVAVVSPLSGSNFTVTVPNPSIAVAGTLLTLSQGASTSTAVVSTYTIGAGLTMSGGPNYTIASAATSPTLTLSGANNNSLTAGNNTVTLNTYTTGAGLSISGGPNYTISSVASAPNLTLSGANNNSLTAGNNTVALNTYTAGSGIVMSGGPNYTITSNPAVALSGPNNNSLSVGTTTVALNTYTAGSGIVMSGGPNYTITSNPAVALSGPNNNSLSVGTTTVALNTYTTGAGLSISGGPNYTISSVASAPNLALSGANNNSLTAGNNTVTLNTYTAGSGIVMSGGPDYTITSNPAVALSGPNNNSLSVGTTTVALNTYTTGAGLSISGGPDYTITSTATSPSIQGAGIAVVSPLSGSDFTVSVPGPSVTIAGTLLTINQGAAVSSATLPNYTAGTGISITGGPLNYVVNSTAVTPSIQGSGLASVTPPSGSSFTVSVPEPTLSMAGNVLTLSQGTAVTNASIPSTSVTGSGLVTVSQLGSVYNVSVTPPGFIATGATTMQGSYPSYTIHTPVPPTPTVVGTGAAVVTPSTGLNYVVDVPPTNITASTGIATIGASGTNSFNVHVPAPVYVPLTGALNTGTATTNITQAVTFTNSILTVGPASNSVTLPAIVNTSISPAGSASVIGVFPSFTISTPLSPTIQGTGLAIVSPSTGANMTVHVPPLTYTAASGLLGSGTNTVDITSPLTINGATITSGPASNSINLSGLTPFTTAGTSVYQTTLSNFVGIGTNAPSAKLDIVETATFTGVAFKAQNGNAANASNLADLSSNGTGNVLNVFSSNTSTTTYAGMFDGGVRARGKASSGGYVIRALDFSANDVFVVKNDGKVGIAISTPSANLHVISTTTAEASYFEVANSSGTTHAVVALSNSNNQHTMRVLNTSLSSLTVAAGFFEGGLVGRAKNNAAAYAFKAQENSGSDVFTVRSDGYTEIRRSVNTGYDFSIQNNGPSNFASMQIRNGSSASLGFVIGQNNANVSILNYENTPIFFGTNGANRMMINNDGNVGIGFGTPTATFQVNGTTRLVDGTQAANKVLTSDAVGNASWQAILPVPSGAVIAYAGPTTTIPGGWLICDGAAVNRATYAVLFAAIGTSWGIGNGTTTFNLPDMRGMFARGVDGPLASNDPDHGTRTATNGGNPGNAVGSVQQDLIENHTHAVSNIGTNNAMNHSVLLGPTLTGYDNSGSITTGNNSAGGSETRPKNVYVYYIIKL